MPKTPFERTQSANNSPRNIREPKRKSFRKGSVAEVTWDAIPEGIISSIVRCTTTQGASPTFGYTRNGSSLTIAIYYKGDRQVDYLAGTEEVTEYLTWLIEEYFELGPSELAYYGLGATEK